MEASWGLDIQRHVFLTSALDGGEWSASHRGSFTLRDRASGTHWTGGWVGLRAGLNEVAKYNLNVMGVQDVRWDQIWSLDQQTTFCPRGR
jgi:hypothetical protein